MGARNILVLNQERYAQQNEEKLLCFADDYYYNKHFLLGKKVNRDELNHVMVFHSFLCVKNCELTDLIRDKIAGKLEPKKKKNPIILPSTVEDIQDIIFNAENYWDKEVEW